MATSSSVNFSVSRDDICTRAVRILGGVESGETLSTEELTDAAAALNGMVKRWQANEVKLWKVADCILYLTKGQYVYEIGGTTPADKASYERITDVGVKTELSAIAALGAGTISVDSITNMASADNVGVVQDDDTIHWTTINGAPAGTTVTLTAVTTVAAAVDNHVYTYTTALPRPLRIIGARRRDGDTQDIPIIKISRQEYQDLPNKTTTGKITQIYYKPDRDKGYIYVWPAPEDVNDRIVFTAYLPIEDFDAAGDTPDFPQEWYDALAFGLAVALAPEYGVVGQEKMEITQQAGAYLKEVKAWDTETASIMFAPDYRYDEC